MLRVGAYSVNCDFVIAADKYTIGAVSYYDRSLSMIKAFGAMLCNEKETLQYKDINGEPTTFILKGNQFNTIIQPVTKGKDKFYHAVSINSDMNKNMILFRKGNEGIQFFNYLMKEYDYPLLKEWGDALYTYASQTDIFTHNYYQGAYRGQFATCDTFEIGGEHVSFDDFHLESVVIDEEKVKNMIQTLLQDKVICISKNEQKDLMFNDMDSYINTYGTTLVDNLNKSIVPLRPLDGEVHDFTLKSMTLYPQQIVQINGAVAMLEESSDYAILNHGMGTGKTIVGSSVAEAYFVRKWLRKNPKKTLKDAYAEDGNICYRNVVMCPGHLVEKWAHEINSEIPYAKAVIIRDFSQLLELRERGAKRTGKEWYVFSKDFGKLTYQLEPSPKKQRYGVIKEKVCTECKTVYYTAGHTCPNCSSKKYNLLRTHYKAEGMVCPHCNNILFPYRRANLDPYSDNPTNPLTSVDFAMKTNTNSRCYYCEEELWVPHVALLGDSKKNVKWIRATHYANKTHKGKKTVWVHKDYMEDYFSSIGEQPLKVNDKDIATGSRKFAPTEFIKKYLKGYFDIAVFDEVHELKGGGTGQGMAMHSLVKATKKQIALTGTIAGGYATNLFYLLYRLEPERMRQKGYKYSDELKFAEKYGKVEREFAYSGSTEVYNTACKGKQKGTPRMKPGISPLIYMDFLLDRTTNLDLADMSKYLPDLKENVVQVAMDDEVEASYKRVIKTLVGASKKKGSGGKALLSTMLQFSLSYLDKPYGTQDILSPLSGAVIASPDNYNEYKDIEDFENLLPKEKKLIELVKSELDEHRNCFVYAEYTASPITCVSYRLKEILEKHCGLQGKVAVLESSSPSPAEREEWIKVNAEKGIKVFITNPQCVATGLDFTFKRNGKQYNYPTIIFYQMGYSMFLVSQASRRHYRLNQTRECRTYYMCYEGTAQEAAISLIAEKQVSTSAIQGKFSTEGLAAMANGVDTRLKLAQCLSEMDTINGNQLQNMFDVLNKNDDGEMYKNYKPMLLFRQLVGDEVANAAQLTGKQEDVIDLWSIFNINFTNEDQKDSDIINEDATVETKATNIVKKSKKVAGQLSLF